MVLEAIAKVNREIGTTTAVITHNAPIAAALGVEEQRVNVVIDLDAIDAAEPLGDGCRVEVAITVLQRANRLLAPLGACIDWTRGGPRSWWMAAGPGCAR
jgi:hypothetical protein